MSLLLWTLGAVLFASFLLIVVRGAPFVPTRRRDVDELFSLYHFQPRDVFVDLGSGDGRMVAAAAKRGIPAVGYELNPFLVWYSRYKLTALGLKAQIKLEDYWQSALPDHTAVVFVFLASPFMKKLDTKLQHEAERLGRDITLISYGMKIPEKPIEATRGGYLVYRYKAS